MKLRKLNDEGLRVFREFLQDVRIDTSKMSAIPEMLITLSATSEEIEGAPDLKKFSHPARSFELTGYLHEKLSGLDRAVIEGADGRGDAGFWAAISLFYFDLLFEGSQKILTDNCYIPELGTTMEGVRFFRHRIAGSFRLFHQYNELSEPFLLSSAGVQSDLYRRVTDSVFYTESRCIVEAINLLYFDSYHKKLKDGWNSKNKPGALSRLLAVADQFDLTYDLQGISGERLVAQLPQEFDDWH